MKKIIVNKVKTRAEFLFPCIDVIPSVSLIGLKDNLIVTDLGNGYVRVEAIDKTKLL